MVTGVGSKLELFTKPGGRDAPGFHCRGSGQDLDSLLLKHALGSSAHPAGDHQFRSLFFDPLGEYSRGVPGRRDHFHGIDLAIFVDFNKGELFTVSEMLAKPSFGTWYCYFHFSFLSFLLILRLVRIGLVRPVLFHVGGLDRGQAALREAADSRRGGPFDSGIDLNPGIGENVKGSRAAVPGDDRVYARPHQVACRLDSGSFQGQLIQIVYLVFILSGIHVIDNEADSPTETVVYWAVQILSRGRYCYNHGPDLSGRILPATRLAISAEGRYAGRAGNPVTN